MYGRCRCMFLGLGQDFFLGLRPVFEIAPADSPTANVDFFGAAADGLVQIGRRLRPGLGIGFELSGGVHGRRTSCGSNSSRGPVYLLHNIAKTSSPFVRI